MSACDAHSTISIKWLPASPQTDLPGSFSGAQLDHGADLALHLSARCAPSVTVSTVERSDCVGVLPMQDRLPQNVIDDINAALGAAREAKDLDDAAAIREKASALQQARFNALPCRRIRHSLHANSQLMHEMPLYASL